MATMTIENGLWVLEQTATRAGTSVDLLTTENKFIDKNISIRSIIPSANNPVLSIADKNSTDITIGTVTSQGYYPLSASLTGALTVGTAGWVDITGFNNISDTSVIVGRIQQSVLANGETPIDSGATIIPSVSSNQTINISAGYNDARTVIIAPMSSGTAAAANVTVSGTAAAPTLANTERSIDEKTQVNITGSFTTTQSDINTRYYMAFTAETPTITLGTSNFTKNITTAGYLGNASQINTSGSINKKSQVYYAKIASGEITIGGNSSTVTNPTLAKYNTEGSNNGKNINSTALTTSNPSLTEPTSGNYVAVSVTIPNVTIAPTVSLNNAGWIGDTNQVNITNVTSSGKTVQVYMPIKSGALAADVGSVTAQNGNISLGTKSSTQPTDGKFIKVIGSGKVKVGTAGYLAAGTSLTSNEEVAFYPVPTATFTIVDNFIKSNAAGWIDANQEITTINVGNLANTPSSGQSYEEVTSPTIITDGSTGSGYLYINKGYFGNTKISLATLIPDDTTKIDVVSGALRVGYEAYDPNGVKIIGGLATYNGNYTVDGWTVA